MSIEDTTPIDIVAELERAARDRHMLHQAAEPSSEADELKLLGDLHWRAAEEIRRLRGIIARHCNPSAVSVSTDDAMIIENAIRFTEPGR
jgi:hypothetical protein